MLQIWSIFCKFGISFATNLIMKKIVYIFALAVLTTVTSIAQEINWVTLDKAIELQKKSPKKIMMDVYTSWCGPCKMLDKNTFHNEDVVKYVNANYYAVKFNAEGNESINYKGQQYSNPNYNPELATRRNSAHELSRYLQIQAYPTIVFMDEKGDVIAPIRGYQTPPQLELYLKMFKADEHIKLDSQEKFNAYYTAFKPEFKG
jgi:thioredoxin-related protein